MTLQAKELERARGKRYRERNKEKKQQRDQEYYKNNKELILTQTKLKRDQNKEQFIEYERSQYERHKTARHQNAKNYYEKNKEVICESEKVKYRQHHIRKWITNIRSRCKKNNIPFDLTIEYVESILPITCPVLGILLEINDNGHRDTSPSLDRIVSSRGYVPGNVNIISWKANRLRSNATSDELEKVLAYSKSLPTEC